MLQEDAVIAVLLCENSVTLKHGSYLAHYQTKNNTAIMGMLLNVHWWSIKRFLFAIYRSICTRYSTRPSVSL